MADLFAFLPTATADYEDEIITIRPQKTMTTPGKFNQVVHEYDSGAVSIVTLGGSRFTIRIQWDQLRASDAQTLVNLYFDTTKAYGMSRTWYLQHPRITGQILVVRFMSELTGVYTGGKPNSEGIKAVDLRVEGMRAQFLWNGIVWNGINWA